jgi:hypothetical protein
LFNAHFLFGCFVADVHETSFTLPDENDHGGKLCFFALNLTIGTNTYFKLVPHFFFPEYGGPYLIFNRDEYFLSAQFSPLLILFHCFVF